MVVNLHLELAELSEEHKRNIFLGCLSMIECFNLMMNLVCMVKGLQKIIISKPHDFTVWKPFVPLVVLYLLGPSLIKQSHQPIFSTGCNQYIQLLSHGQTMFVLIKHVLFFALPLSMELGIHGNQLHDS
jgi:hypothetical protein